MEYLVQRGEQQFGPYTLSELQEYLQSGRLLPGDLAQSEGMPTWTPISQVVGNIPIPVANVAATVQPVQQSIPLPPNLHWAVLLVITFVSRLFGAIFIVVVWVWAMILANWARKLVNNNTAMVLVAMYPAGVIAGAITIGIAKAGGGSSGLGALGAVFILVGVVIYLVGIFKIRAAMEEYYNSRENINLTLSGAMTFFFGLVYLQYHVNRIAKWKKTGILP
jgi:GYF domain 2